MFKTLLIVTSICIQALIAHPILIGIAGGTGSGKTTMAQKIQDAFPDQSILICQDSYYKDLSHLTMEEKARKRLMLSWRMAKKLPIVIVSMTDK